MLTGADEGDKLEVAKWPSCGESVKFSRYEEVVVAGMRGMHVRDPA